MRPRTLIRGNTGSADVQDGGVVLASMRPRTLIRGNAAARRAHPSSQQAVTAAAHSHPPRRHESRRGIGHDLLASTTPPTLIPGNTPVRSAPSPSTGPRFNEAADS